MGLFYCKKILSVVVGVETPTYGLPDKVEIMMLDYKPNNTTTAKFNFTLIFVVKTLQYKYETNKILSA